MNKTGKFSDKVPDGERKIPMSVRGKVKSLTQGGVLQEPNKETPRGIDREPHLLGVAYKSFEKVGLLKCGKRTGVSRKEENWEKGGRKD